MIGEWGIYIVLYFWLAAMGGGAFLIALGLRDERAKRSGAFLAFVGVVVGALLLVVDLGQPLRFWHLLAGIHPISVMWLGSAVLALAGLGLFLLLIMREWPGWLVWVTAALVLLVVGYTGVLLMATARPFWSGSPLMPWIFLASAYTTGAALLVLLGNHEPGLRRVSFNFALIEVVLVAAHLIWTYPKAQQAIQASLTGELAWAFWGFVILGVALPLYMELQRKAEALAALLVLAGGFLLRYFIVYAGQVGVLRF
jgi:polysulfide reductase chain C